MKAYYRIAIGAVITALAILFFKILIGGNTIALFNPQGPTASAERNVIVTTVLIMLAIVIPMLALLFTFAWKYREGNQHAKYDPELSHGTGRQLLMWAIPAIFVAALAVVAWKSAHALDPYAPIGSAAPGTPPLTIQVVALPWKWLFIYPAQNIATVNFIEFPAGTPVHFELTADAPMSSFWIPQLGSQIYAMAAMETQINLMASTTGEYTGKDTEINGAGYAGMTFVAKSGSQSDFDAWVASVRQSPNGALDLAAYNALAAPSEYVPSSTYASVSHGLFDGIMMKFMEPTSSIGTQSGPSGSQQTMPADMPGMSM